MEDSLSLTIWQRVHDAMPAANCAVCISAANMARFKRDVGVIETVDGKHRFCCAVMVNSCCAVMVNSSTCNDYVGVTVGQRNMLGLAFGASVALRKCTAEDRVTQIADMVVVEAMLLDRASGIVLRSELDATFRWTYNNCLLNAGQTVPVRVRNFIVNVTVKGIGSGLLMDANTTTVTCTSANPTQLRIVDALPDPSEVNECTVKLFHCYVSSAEKDKFVSVFRITTDGMDACRKALSEKHGTLERLRLVSEADYDDLAGDGPRAMNELRAVLCCFLEDTTGGDGFDLGVYNPIDYKSVVTAFNLYCTSSVHCTLRVKGADNKA